MKNKFILSSSIFLFVALIFLIYPQISFAAAPTVVTNTSSASSTEATMHGEATVIEGGYDLGGFVLGTASVADADGGNYNIGTSTVIISATTTVGSWSQTTTTLSKGEVYFFRAYAASSTDLKEITYGSEAQFITGIDEPTGLAKTTGSQSNLSLSWATTTGAHTVQVEVRYGTGSYPTSISDGTQGCKVNSTTCTVSGLSCGLNYYFRAWATTTDTIGGMSTSSDSYSELIEGSSSCTITRSSGGRSLTAPTIYDDSLVIEQGATSTKTREVTLTLKASNVALMTICNRSDFLNCWLEDYNETKSWTLTGGDGVKTVYAKFVSPDGMNSDVASAIITLEIPVAVEEEVIVESAPVVEPVVEEVAQEKVVEKPIAEMTADEIKVKITELQQQIIELLNQLIQLLLGQIAAL